MAGIYIHVPFCARRCLYCAFYSTLRHEERQRYTDCLCRELAQRANTLNGHEEYTIYLGGGTPSQLSLEQIACILDSARSVCSGGRVVETTVECNPDDLTPSFASGLRDLGVDRISMGVQTFNDGLLSFLGRRHTADQATLAVRTCQDAGFRNISIDLMYGLPGQTLEIQKQDLETATSLNVQHISSYCLSFDEGSPLFRLRQQGKVEPASDEMCRSMYFAMCSHLASHGFLHYEISNFSLPGFHSRHNSSYWNATAYMGVGAAAHSYDGRCRSWNPSDLSAYMSGIVHDSLCPEEETLTAAGRMNETVMLSLRTLRGLDLSAFGTEFGQVQAERLKKEAARFISAGRLTVKDNRMSIPEEYWFVSDDIISSLFLS